MVTQSGQGPIPPCSAHQVTVSMCYLLETDIDEVKQCCPVTLRSMYFYCCTVLDEMSSMEWG